MKNALARLAIATCAIALCLTSTPAWGCAFGKQKTTQVTWLRSPLVLLLAVPGTLLATALYWGGRSFEQQE